MPNGRLDFNFGDLGGAGCGDLLGGRGIDDEYGKDGVECIEVEEVWQLVIRMLDVFLHLIYTLLLRTEHAFGC